MNFLFYGLFVFIITTQAANACRLPERPDPIRRAALAKLWMDESENPSAYCGPRNWEKPYESPGEFSDTFFTEKCLRNMYHCVRFDPKDFVNSGLPEALQKQASRSEDPYCHLRLCLRIFKGIDSLVAKETRSLSLTGNFVNKISANDFQGLSSIEKLYLGGCDIRVIDPNAFKNFKCLRLLVLEDNPISEDPESRKTLKEALSKNNPECEIVWGPISR